jgi:hypothetical protein
MKVFVKYVDMMINGIITKVLQLALKGGKQMIKIIKDKNGCVYLKDSREHMIWNNGFKAGQESERALLKKATESDELVSLSFKQAREQARQETLESTIQAILQMNPENRNEQNYQSRILALFEAIKAKKVGKRNETDKI